MKIKKRLFALFIAIVMLLPGMIACGKDTPADNTPETVTLTLNGTSLSDYTIVYSDSGLDFNKRAAEYISKSVEAVTGTAPAVVLDTESTDNGNEILVGITNRVADAFAVEDFENVFKFASVTKGDSVLLYGEEYMIAGAAYDLVKKIAETKDVTISTEITVGEPVFEEVNNIIFLIGDGMGFNSLKMGVEMYETDSNPRLECVSGYHQYSVADRLPYKAQSYTHSLDSDITDSAAGGTALATGYKTYNDVIALNGDLKEVKSLTELAYELGKKTAVMTTDNINGATPSTFSVHNISRDNKDELLISQENTDFDLLYGDILDPVASLRKMFRRLENDDKGFFVMYEEAHIDKSAHDENKDEFYQAYTRLNTALRVAFEFMMYNPDTALILTADHETGGITFDEETGRYEFTRDSHSQVNVPFYAIGKGTEVIDGKTYDNTGVAKFAARLMGVEDFGDPSISETTDKTGLEVMTEEEKREIFLKKSKVELAYKGITIG